MPMGPWAMGSWIMGRRAHGPKGPWAMGPWTHGPRGTMARGHVGPWAGPWVFTRPKDGPKPSQFSLKSLKQPFFTGGATVLFSYVWDHADSELPRLSRALKPRENPIT